ncbi:MAG: NlpC/P60 family protein [Blastocatellia bacterium]
MPQVADNSPIIATRAEFVAECRRLLSVPWRHQGRSEKGVDCVGLLVLPAIRLGILRPDQDVNNYQRAPHGDRLDCLLHQHCRRLGDWKEAKEADILAIKYFNQPQHVMVVTGPYDPRWGWYVIHAFGNDAMPGKVIEHRLDGNWLKSHRARIHAAFHIKGVGD